MVLKLDSSGPKHGLRLSAEQLRIIPLDPATSDGGYVVAGNTSSYGAGSTNMWIMNLDSSGSALDKDVWRQETVTLISQLYPTEQTTMDMYSRKQI